MGDLLIPQLSKGEWKETICVRASRFWDFCDPQDETKLLHTDLVFIDEEGNSIHAQIYPPLAQEIKPEIKEGSVYNLSCFFVKKKSNRQYKLVSNDNMIGLTSWTEINEVVEIPPAFPVLTYSLTPIEQIHSRIDDKEYFTESAPTQLSAMEIPTSASILNAVPLAHLPRGQVVSPTFICLRTRLRYKLFLTAGDETGDTDFVLFGRIAQCIVKRPADILIAENPVGFMPDAITKLLERTFIWNVSFTKNTITSGNVCFLVNAIVGEIDTGNGVMPMSPGGSHQSSLMVSQGASSSLQNTPEKGTGLVLPTPLTPQGAELILRIR